jgi:hypothetical protein
LMLFVYIFLYVNIQVYINIVFLALKDYRLLIFIEYVNG